MIGMFDSGVGGLSVLRQVLKHYPDTDVVYFGDTKNAPYGIKSQEELSKLTADAISFLQAEGADMIVSACNSVSASLVTDLLVSCNIKPQQLIEMVAPTVSYFKDSEAKLALCATPATIDSGIYQNAFGLLGKSVQYIAIKELAGAIEGGAPEKEIEDILEKTFEKEGVDFDILILSCTHFPFVRGVFEKILPKAVQIFNPAETVAKRLYEVSPEQTQGESKLQFYVSKTSLVFNKKVRTLFPDKEYKIDTVDIKHHD